MRFGMSKYRNKPTTVGGYRFDSKKEAKRYSELSLLVAASAITHLKVHPKFPITVNGAKCGYYEADFEYLDRLGNRVIEDAKGFRTPLYKLKKKLVEALYGVTITEV